jgi:hypothetical protein
VWDHVTSQCHNFQRQVGGNNNPDIWVDKEYLDGKGHLYGFTVVRPGSGPNTVTLDVMETWHP